MRKRYLDLTPGELQARRLIFWGSALFIMPPLLTLCHMQQFLCQASWENGAALLVAIGPLFVWLIPVAALMLAGLLTATLGAALLLYEKHRAARPRPAYLPKGIAHEIASGR
jgi:hypothetical protein